ncbi:adhesion G protein-coupled receptor L4-like [Ptychodera flava]|uniref:adhesion G protein-coupled receptor L4-like n=1 Tax=Ptychodera flava TaxID=63121 RepID=UPI00396A991B
MQNSVVLLILIFWKSSRGACPSGWIASLDGSQCFYEEISLEMERHHAVHYCTTKEASIAIFPTYDEMLNFCNSITESNSFWIGVKFATTPAQYTWDDGQPLTWDNWNDDDDEPDTQKQCVILNSDETGCLWETKDCDATYRPICQRSSTVVDLCPPTWLAYPTSCIKMEWSAKEPYFTAKDTQCSPNDGTLVSIPVDDKRQFLLSMMAIYNGGPYWIGYDADKTKWWTGESMNQLDYTLPWDSWNPAADMCTIMFESDMWKTEGCNKKNGYICEHVKDECRSSPCLNGGICSNAIGGFRCDCGGAYTGLLCETEIVPSTLPPPPTTLLMTSTLKSTNLPASKHQTTRRLTTMGQGHSMSTVTSSTSGFTLTYQTGTSKTSWSMDLCTQILNDTYYDNCWNEELLNLSDEYMDSEKNPVVLFQTLSRLQHITFSSLLYPKDVEIAFTLFRDILVNNPLPDNELTIAGRNTFIENSIKTVNNMLNADYGNQWDLVGKFTDRDPIELASVIDTFSDDVIDYMVHHDIKIFSQNNTNIKVEYRLLDVQTFSKGWDAELCDGTSVTVPEGLYAEYIGDQDKIGIEHAIYTSVSQLSKISHRNLTLGSNLLSLELHPPPVSPFEENVWFSFNHDTVGNETLCAFLNETGSDKGVWSDEGCQVVETSLHTTICSCNHLTSFAILMQPVDFHIPESHQKALSIITFVGCGVSLVSLFATFVILAYFRLNSERVTILQNMVIALMMAQFTFIIGITATENRKVCRFVAILLHYLYLASFFWMMVQGIQLYIKIRNVFNHSAKVIQFLFLGWGVPIVIVSMSAGIKWQYYGNDKYCWLSLEDGLPSAFIIPAIAVVAMNFFVLTMVMRAFMTVRVNAKKSDIEKMKAGIRAGLVLVPLLGLSWVFGVLAVNEDTLFFQYLFTITNSFQGFFVFIFHCYLNDEVKTAFNKKFRRGSVSCDSKSSATKTVSEAWSENAHTHSKTKPHVKDQVKSLSSLRKAMTCDK